MAVKKEFQVPKGVLQTEIAQFVPHIAVSGFQVPKGMLQTRTRGVFYTLPFRFQVPKGMLQAYFVSFSVVVAIPVSSPQGNATNREEELELDKEEEQVSSPQGNATNMKK